MEEIRKIAEEAKKPAGKENAAKKDDKKKDDKKAKSKPEDVKKEAKKNTKKPSSGKKVPEKKEVKKEEKKKKKEEKKEEPKAEEASAEEEKCNKNSNIIKAQSEEVNHELEMAKQKLDVARQKILDLDIKVLQPLGKTNVPTSIKFYFECCGIIMSKRLAIIENFGELLLNKDTKVRYYSPLGWTTMISYIKSNSYGSFFDTIKEFQEKLIIIN